MGADEHRDVGRHLVVARAGGVELAARVADQLGQAALDRHVDVLVVLVDLEAVLVELGADFVQPPLDLLEILGADDLAAGEHARVGERLFEVVGRQTEVELDRRVQPAEGRVLRLAEAGHRLRSLGSDEARRTPSYSFLSGLPWIRSWIGPRSVLEHWIHAETSPLFCE